MKNREIKRLLSMVLCIMLVLSNIAYADTVSAQPTPAISGGNSASKNIMATINVTSATTVEVTMAEFASVEFDWNKSTVTGIYADGKYTLTVPSISATVNTLRISVRGYKNCTEIVTITENAGNLLVIHDATELDTAITNQADNQTWIIKAGDYAVESKYRFDIDSVGDNGYNKYYFPIKANNLKIIGEGNPVIYGSTLTLNGVRATQNFITVMADGVTIDGVTIMSKLAPNKAIEVAGDRGGKNFTLKNSTVTKNTKVTYNNEDVDDYFGKIEKLTSDDIDFPGSVYFYKNVGNSVVENVVIEKGRISAGTINDGASLELKDVVIDYVGSVEAKYPDIYVPISTSYRAANVTADKVIVKVDYDAAQKLQSIIDNVPLKTKVELAAGTYYNATGLAPTAPKGVTIVNKGATFVKADKIISTAQELSDAILNQADGQTWVIKAGNYGMGKVNTAINEFINLTANDLTIIGIDNPVIYGNIIGAGIDNFISVRGNNVNIDGITFMPMMSNTNQTLIVHESAPIFTIKNSSFKKNIFDTAGNPSAGALYLIGNKSNILIEDNIFEYACLTFDSVNSKNGEDKVIVRNNNFNLVGTFAISNVTWTTPAILEMQNIEVTSNNFNLSEGSYAISNRMNDTNGHFILTANTINNNLAAFDSWKEKIQLRFNWYIYSCPFQTVEIDGQLYQTPRATIGGEAYSTIQAAIDAANAGDTIIATAGTYELKEQLKIVKPITIKGIGDVTIVPAADFNVGTYSADKHLISINSVTGLVQLENLIISNSKRTGINVFESDNVILSDITSKDNAAAGLVVNNSIVVADNLNTSENGWGYGINVDNGSSPSAGAPATSFTLNSGTISEPKQIVSDKGGVTIIAPNYQVFINDESIIFGATITSWYAYENEGTKYDLLDTSVNFNFDNIDISGIDSIKFSLYQDNTLLGTAISTGNNLVTLLKDCAQYWGKTADTYIEVSGIRTMSSAFMNRTEESNNGYWVRSVCTATNESVPNGLVVEVVAGNVTYTTTYRR